MRLTTSLGIKVTDQNGKLLVKLTKQGQVEKRFSMKTGKAIQIVFKNGEIVHLHCKDQSCDNEWKTKEGTDWGGKFDVKGTMITCLKCGRAYLSG